MSDFAVETVELSKTYAGRGKLPPKKALNNVSLAIPKGSFFGLLGPNGAGKSTLINILAGLVNKTSGEARIWDHDIESDMRAARRAIGIVPQELNIDPFFTPRESLEVQAGMFGVPKKSRRTEEILKQVGLLDKADAYARTLSGGMRRRLLVAKAMVHAPKVLVLDEPTAGVDVELRHQLWESVKEMNAQGTTVMLTTHYLEEAEQLCDRIAIINHGEMIACDTKDALLGRLDAKELTVIVNEDVCEVPEGLKQFNVERRPGNRFFFKYRPSQTQIRDILRAVNEAGLSILDLTTAETDLEDIFLSLTRADDNGENA
ncbi:MAG: ABC transporter ATP-binding protein [Rhodospirillales bacterium]|nr:ABC transporter ATP-binding protein [Rhodospirillales bacterium]